MNRSSSNSPGFYLISYDIVADKRRNKVAKIIKNAGTRVQYSVFEANIDSRRLTMVLRKIEGVIDLKEDSVRVYRFCAGCQKVINILGRGEVTRDDDYYII